MFPGGGAGRRRRPAEPGFPGKISGQRRAREARARLRQRPSVAQAAWAGSGKRPGPVLLGGPALGAVTGRAAKEQRAGRLPGWASLRTRGGHMRRRIVALVRLGDEMKGRREMTGVRRHHLVIGGVSLAAAGLAAGLWLAVPASASSSAHAAARSSSRSGTAQTVGRTATAPPAGGSPHWGPAGSGPPPTPPPGLGGPPHWAPAGSGPPPAAGVSGAASGS
jgi:hypothetical protein